MILVDLALRRLLPPTGSVLICSLCAQTPNQYIRWRYASGEDRESVEKMSRQAQEEDEKAMQQQIKTEDGVKRILDKLLGRRKAKRSYEYEVSLTLPAGSSHSAIAWHNLGAEHRVAAPPCNWPLACMLHVILFSTQMAVPVAAFVRLQGAGVAVLHAAQCPA